MDLDKAVSLRRSIRKFDPKVKVSDEDLQEIIDAATHAPSAGNLQNWRFIVVEGKERLGAVADRISIRATLMISFSLISATLFWLTLATREWILYTFAVVFGFAYGGFAATAGPLVAELFGLRSLGLIFGLADNGFTIGAAVGPLLAGYIFDVTGSYQFAFVSCAIISIVGLVLTVILKPPHPHKA